MNTTIAQREVTEADLAKLCAMLNAKHAEYREFMGYTGDLNAASFSVEVGPKYGHIIRTEAHGNSRSSAGMIEMATGNIYASAGWGRVNKTAPKATKGVRGNIFTEDGGAETFNHYGVQYTAKYLASRAGRFC